MKILEKKQGLIGRAIDDEYIVLNPEDGYMHLLNTTGKEIWELLNTCSTLEDLVENMYLRYNGDISREILRNDINEIVKSLTKNRLVMEQDKSDSESD